MWYQGIDFNAETNIGRIGYAVSPAGMQIELSSSHVPIGTALYLGIRVADPAGLSFSARVHSSDNVTTESVKLFDDGQHGDGLNGDGYFGNAWIPKKKEVYLADFKLESQGKSFLLSNATAFTTIGPLRFDGMELVGDMTPHPGDSILLKVKVHNDGTSGVATSVMASLSSADSPFIDVVRSKASCGDIPAGVTATTTDTFRLFIHPDCPINVAMAINVSVSSLGYPLWHDKFSIHVMPPWYRTSWAYSLYAVLVLGLTGGSIRYVGVRKLKRRIEQLEREQALEHERRRISADMHDEVGARLTEIGILSELARKDIGNRGKAEEHVQKISQASREVIANIGEIIWAIDTRNDSLDDLVAYLRQYTSKYFEATSIQCEFDIPEKIPTTHFSAEKRRNIFLVVKEALHNIVKHSKATSVRISASFSGGALEIHVEDNGQGFDTKELSRFGNGLRNMATRMNDVGGSLEISSKQGQGTKVTIRC